MAAFCVLLAIGVAGAGRAGAQGGDLEPPTITSADGVTFTVGQQGSFTVTTTPGNDANGDGDVALSESGALPDGITFMDNGDGTAFIAGTPADGTGGAYAITITASNGVSPDATQSFTLSVEEPPTITSADGVTFTVGQQGSFTVTTTPGNDANGDGDVALSESGALPDGITFMDNGDGTATIAGTADAGAAGVYNVTITASNGVASDATQAFTLTVQAGPSSVGISGPSSLNATNSYAATATASGAVPAPTFALVSGAPAWLDVDTATGAITGTPPSGTTSFSYQVTATNVVGTATSAEQTVTVVVAPTSVSVTGPPSQVVGTTYQAAAAAQGADVATTYALVSGAPSWLSIDAGTGAISGVIPEGNPGYYDYEVVASDSDGSSTSPEQFVTVAMGSTTVSLQTSEPGTVLVGTQVTYSATVAETDGSGALSGSFSFKQGKSSVSGCQNLTLSGATASCTMTFTAAGNFNITASYGNDPYFTSSSASTLQQVVAPQVPRFTSAADSTARVGSAFSFDVTASGLPTPTVSESGALPSGVTFEADPSSGSGTLSGVPAGGTGGTYSVTLKASNSAGSTTQTFALTVDQPAGFTSASASTADVGTASSFKVTTGGYPAASVSESGSLPSGVTFTAKSSGTATLAGTPGPGTSGSYPITLSATNGIGSTSTQDFLLTVNQGPIFTSTSSTTATVGASFSFAVAASGSPAPTISEKGALPSGVTFQTGPTGSATIFGSPAAGSGGIHTFTVTATNSAGSSSQSFTLTVDQSPAITSAGSANATVGAKFSFTVSTTGYPACALSESGSLPAGLKFKPGTNGTATITGTPAAGSAGTYDITVTASNGVGSEATVTLAIKVKA